MGNGHDIGSGNKKAIKGMMGDDFEPTWKMAEELVKEHSELLFLPPDVAVEIDQKRHQMSWKNYPLTIRCMMLESKLSKT